MESVSEKDRRIKINLTWLIRKYIPKVVAIEEDGFLDPWTLDDFIKNLQKRNCIGMVAENYNNSDQILGYMVYKLYAKRIDLVNLAVSPDYWRRKVGTQMIDKLICKLSKERRNRIKLNISEKNLRGQLFFRSCGFKMRDILHNHFENFLDGSFEDGYTMEYRYSDNQIKPGFNLPYNNVDSISLENKRVL